MLQLKQKSGKLYLYQKYSFPTPEGAVNHGNIVNPDSLIRELKLAKHKIRWHGNRVNLSLDNRSCYLRTLIMPEMPDRELDRAMRLEAEKNFPLKFNQALISYKALQNQTSSNYHSTKYLLTIVPKEIADTYTSFTTKAGFKPILIDTAQLALLHSFNHDRDFKTAGNGSIHVIINYGNETTGILITASRDYLFHRNLNFGINHFTRAINTCKITDHREAQRYIFKNETLANKGLLDIAAKLSEKIGQTLEYCFKQESIADNKMPATVSVCGGAIFIPGLAAYFQNDLQIKLNLYNPLSSLSRNSVTENNTINNEGALFAIAHGLALRGWFK